MWTIQTVGTALGQIIKKNGMVNTIQFDSREVTPGDCFIALPGTESDGNDFIDEARNRGAICIIGQKNADFVVPDSFQALNQLAAYAKNCSPAKRVAITGSVGKTTTTTFLAQILEQDHKVISPQDSFNNHIGVPLTMTKLSPMTEFGIFEIGTNHPGEIRPLANLASPHIAIITKVGMAHIGYFNDLRAIAEEKAQILYALTDDGIGIVPDDEFLPIYQQSGKRLVVIPKPENLMPTIPQRLQGGIAMAKKAAELLNVYDFDITKLSVPQGRGAIYTQRIDGKTVTIVDDSYNAAFDAFSASLDDLSKRDGYRKILVVGDMGEVGELAEAYHAQIAKKINRVSGIRQVIPVSPLISAALKVIRYTQDDALKRLHDVIEEGDIIFFKGSKVSEVSKILHQFTATCS